MSKSSEKELRQKIEAFPEAYRSAMHRFPPSAWYDWACSYLRQALAASEQTDLERLRQRIVEHGGDYEVSGRPETASIRIDRLLDWIADEFGVGVEVKE